MSGILSTAMIVLIVAFPQPSQELQRETGVVTGRLIAKDGSPLPDIRVTAMAVPETADAADGAVLVSLAQTDASGRYRLEGIPPGKYYITAGFVTSPTFYPGVTSKGEATVLLIAAGQTRTNIDFQTTSSTSLGANIRGRVIQVPGSGPNRPFGLSEITSVAKNVVVSGSAGTFSIPLQPDGTFELPKVPPGTYLLRVPPLFGASATVTVTDRDITNLEIHVPFVTQASGRIIADDGKPLPSDLTLALRSPNRESNSSVSSNGTFTAILTEGVNQIGVNGLPLGYAIQSISYAGRDIGKGPLQIGQKPAEGDIVITVSFTPVERVVGFRLSGKARNVPMELFVAGLPILHLDRIGGGPVLETLLQPDGSFVFPKVPPGSYAMNFNHRGPRFRIPDIIVRDSDSEISLDLENNPFPEFPASSVAGVFNFGSTLTLNGVISQKITQMRPNGAAPARYFRIDTNNPKIHWAILMFDTNAVEANPNMTKLHVGAHVRVIVNPAMDGNPRGVLVPQSGANTAFGVILLDN